MSGLVWIDAATDYRCRIVDQGPHLCGYVAVPADHPLHGKDYTHEVERPAGFDETPIGKRGMIPLFIAANSDEGSIGLDCLFDVHGSLTFAGKMGSDADWWFGFDCAHSGDTRERCDEAYVRAECASLARQLKKYAESRCARRIERSSEAGR